MLWVFPHLRGEQYQKALTLAFWVFTLTCLVLIATILGIRAGAITPEIARIISQGIGPACAINTVTLIFLADQNRRMADNQ